jgi:hypothetical protein
MASSASSSSSSGAKAKIKTDNNSLIAFEVEGADFVLMKPTRTVWTGQQALPREALLSLADCGVLPLAQIPLLKDIVEEQRRLAGKSSGAKAAPPAATSSSSSSSSATAAASKKAAPPAKKTTGGGDNRKMKDNKDFGKEDFLRVAEMAQSEKYKYDHVGRKCINWEKISDETGWGATFLRLTYHNRLPGLKKEKAKKSGHDDEESDEESEEEEDGNPAKANRKRYTYVFDVTEEEDEERKAKEISTRAVQAGRRSPRFFESRHQGH